MASVRGALRGCTPLLQQPGSKQVEGYSNAEWKGFREMHQARDYVNYTDTVFRQDGALNGELCQQSIMQQSTAYAQRTTCVCATYCGVRAAYVRVAGAYTTHRKPSLRTHTKNVRTTYERRTCGERAAYVRRKCGIRAVCVANYLNPAFEDYCATIAD